jgi:hypothetical protein
MIVWNPECMVHSGIPDFIAFSLSAVIIYFRYLPRNKMNYGSAESRSEILRRTIRAGRDCREPPSFSVAASVLICDALVQREISGQ